MANAAYEPLITGPWNPRSHVVDHYLSSRALVRQPCNRFDHLAHSITRLIGNIAACLERVLTDVEGHLGNLLNVNFKRELAAAAHTEVTVKTKTDLHLAVIQTELGLAFHTQAKANIALRGRLHPAGRSDTNFACDATTDERTAFDACVHIAPCGVELHLSSSFELGAKLRISGSFDLGGV